MEEMDMPKDMAVLDTRTVERRAEILMAMDVLMRHVSDEFEQDYWLMHGVPDGAPKLRMTQEQIDYYGQFADSFEYLVKMFASAVRRVFFKTTYEPRGFC